MMEKYITAYKNLSEEKQYWLKIASIILFSFILYRAIFLYLHRQSSLLEQKIENEKDLIVWVQGKSSIIREVQKNKLNKIKKRYTIADIETGIKNFNLDPYVIVLRQNEDNNIEVSLQNVPFNLFYGWLLELNQKTNFDVDTLSIKNRGKGLTDIILNINLMGS